MNEPQEQFIIDEFFDCTVRGAFQRARIYRPEAGERARAKFREALRSSLTKRAVEYSEPVSEDDHVANIVSLADELSDGHTDVLVNGRFRIGVAQKALNLYLKYLWCIGKATTPPHCPFDAVVIQMLVDCGSMNWTKLDSAAEYRMLVTAAKTRAAGKTLAEWELETYGG